MVASNGIARVVSPTVWSVCSGSSEHILKKPFLGSSPRGGKARAISSVVAPSKPHTVFLASPNLRRPVGLLDSHWHTVARLRLKDKLLERSIAKSQVKISPPNARRLVRLQVRASEVEVSSGQEQSDDQLVHCQRLAQTSTRSPLKWTPGVARKVFTGVTIRIELQWI
jgi:hypothetical protein